MKCRLDQLLVQRDLADSREKAHALILAGAILVDGQKMTKPGHTFAADCEITVLHQLPYVSRGGIKLAAALDHWSIDPAGRVCADIGASTGGFTDCLLQRGAARVHTVDVGPSQLAWKIQTDPRVVVHDHTNARNVEPTLLGEAVSLLVVDVAFISATLVLPAVCRLLTETAEAVVLVKPQFEVGRESVGKGGIVREPHLHQAACVRVTEALQSENFVTDLIASPILGTEGNQEFLLYGHR